MILNEATETEMQFDTATLPIKDKIQEICQLVTKTEAFRVSI